MQNIFLLAELRRHQEQIAALQQKLAAEGQTEEQGHATGAHSRSVPLVGDASSSYSPHGETSAAR